MPPRAENGGQPGKAATRAKGKHLQLVAARCSACCMRTEGHSICFQPNLRRHVRCTRNKSHRHRCKHTALLYLSSRHGLASLKQSNVLLPEYPRSLYRWPKQGGMGTNATPCYVRREHSTNRIPGMCLRVLRRLSCTAVSVSPHSFLAVTRISSSSRISNSQQSAAAQQQQK